MPTLSNETLQEGIDILWGLGHGLFQRIGSIVGIAHDLGLLCTQLGYLADEGIGIELSRSISAMDGGFIDLTAHVAIVETCKQWLLRGVDNDNSIRSLTATALGIFLTLLDIGSTQPSELILTVYPYHGVVSSFEQCIAPLLLQFGDAEVNGLHAIFLLV